ncbi:sugar ABC transporter permease [Niameybacter massiliensis]|uniref:Sugar ABC transporter permease n=1 Tax=Holtiella tumoricola TaxID=3018743 RepID=A0AA42DKT4_9FIRM|nr:sugar ABC transporter permease [Holtiella tumoricola]MDA3730851.1 sugar ABC transporter permease [Holtiella tumoricola]
MASKKKVVSWEKKRSRMGYVFILPFIIGSIVFLLIPVVTSLIYSLSKLTVNTTGYELEFVGLANFKQLVLVDPVYRKVLVEALTELINVPITVIFSFFMASLLNQKFRGRGLVRGIFFLPVILSSGVYIQLERMDQLVSQYAQTGQDAYYFSGAFINLLNMMDLNQELILFLTSSVSRIGTIVAMSAIPIVIFLAGFQAISPSIYEAAYMEGGTKWEIFWKISFPMISPLILVCVIYSIVDNFTKSSSVMINLVHRTIFTEFKFGLGSAMVWIFIVVVFAIIGVAYAAINKYVFYYD